MRAEGVARSSGEDGRRPRCRGRPGDPWDGSGRPTRARRSLDGPDIHRQGTEAVTASVTDRSVSTAKLTPKLQFWGHFIFVAFMQFYVENIPTMVEMMSPHFFKTYPLPNLSYIAHT